MTIRRVLALHLLAACPALAQSCTWQNLHSGPIYALTGVLVYDTARHRIVLTAGGNEDAPIMNTYEWDGHGPWTSVGFFGPPGGWGQAMAYDQARQKTVCFGGFFMGEGPGSEIYGDTFEWNGQSWTFRTHSGPSPRAFSVMAYDTIRQHVLLYGGNDGVARGDLWEWNGASWSDISSPGPLPHTDPAVAYDPDRGKLFLHGHDTTGALSTWEWDSVTGTWSQRTAAESPSLYGVSATYDSGRKRIVIPDRTRTWEWDGEAGMWTSFSGTNYPYGFSSSAVYDPANKRTVVLSVVPQQAYLQTVFLYFAGGYANCDHSTAPPVLNVNDFQCFLNTFAAQDPAANCDGSTVPPLLNVNDFQCFLNAFAAGCT